MLVLARKTRFCAACAVSRAVSRAVSIAPKWLILLGRAACAVSIAYSPMCACVGARVQAGAHRRAGAQSRTCRTSRTHPYQSMTYKKNDAAHGLVHTAQSEKNDAPVKKVIRCTPENVGEMRDLVRRWPQLNQLVRDLQAQGLFPGLRGVEITLQGRKDYVAKGLGAVLPENPQKPAKTV